MGALTDKYCIVGLGQTPFMRPSNRTTLSMACEAIRNAIDDAGLRPSDVDGITSYQGGLGGDSTTAAHIGSALGTAIQLRQRNARRRIGHRDADRARDRTYRGRLLQDGGGLPLDERTLGPS